MLSSSVLKSLKVAPNDFYKFVKANVIAKPPTVLDAMRVYRSKLSNTLDRKADKDEYDGRGDPYGDSAGSCCGVYEIGSVEDALELKREMLYGIERGYRCVVYYSISKKITEAALGWGFECVGSFRNHNTNNNIDILILNLWKE